MERKSSSITAIFLLFLLLTVPYFSRGGSNELDLEVYEIDYRGPQTHSSIPPPVNWRGKPLSHRKTAVEPSKSKGLGVGHMGGTVSPRDEACHDRCLVKKLHG